MRFASRITDVVVKAARTRVGPVQDAVDISAADPLFQPYPVVEREIDGVEVSATIKADRLIAWHAELHMDALKKRFGEFEDACAQHGRIGGQRWFIKNPFGFVESSAPQRIHRAILQGGFGEQDGGAGRRRNKRDRALPGIAN